MNFLSVSFGIFIVAFFIIYYMIPSKYRYIALFIGGYVFYGYANPVFIPLLLLVTVIAYLAGICLSKNKSVWLVRLFFALEISVLLVLKYTNFIIRIINDALAGFHLSDYQINSVDLILPVGISFICFQTTTYITDVYRGNIEAEKNFVRFGAFVAFFPTLLSGPIQKSRNLLPQIKSPREFEFENGRKGIFLFAWGVFEKIVVSNSLYTTLSGVYGNLDESTWAKLIIAAACFSVYLYADFSAYSDMARGIALTLGIEVGKNFDNPFLSTTVSELWRRWHVSLNDWFVENVYIPLGGSRKGKLRQYLNMLFVFFISGLWHGASYNFIIWGVLNGIFAVSGQILRPIKEKIYKGIKVDENVGSIRLLKRIGVFCSCSVSFIFFENGINDAIIVVRNILKGSWLSIFDPELLSISGSVVATFLTILFTVIFCIVQYNRQESKNLGGVLFRQPKLIQYLMVASVICVSIFVFYASKDVQHTRFAYFEF